MGFNLIWVVVIAVVVFLLTYNPSSGTLNKYIQKNETPSITPGKNCENAHYESIQFGTGTYACPKELIKTGAILRK